MASRVLSIMGYGALGFTTRAPSDEMKFPMTKMQSRYPALAVAFLLTPQLSADVEITNERNGDHISHRLTCTRTTDIGKSELNGFLRIVIKDGKRERTPDAGLGRPLPITKALIAELNSTPDSAEFFPAIRHLPVSSIVAINDTVGMTRITFRPIKMGNGEGWLTTEVEVPKGVLSAEDVFKLLNSITDPKTAETESAEQGGAEQPATAPESKPEGKQEPKPESEGRSQ